jgi:hypothetical protein
MTSNRPSKRQWNGNKKEHDTMIFVHAGWLVTSGVLLALLLANRRHTRRRRIEARLRS